MARKYYTAAEYSEEFGVPVRTVRHWIRTGRIQARKDVRPHLIPADQKAPVKDPAIHTWRWTFE